MRTEKLYAAIGRQIAATRAERGINKSDLAKALDVSRDYINKIEGGRIRIPLHVLIQIAGLFEIKADDLIPEDIETVFPYFPSSPLSTPASSSPSTPSSAEAGNEREGKQEHVVTDFPAKWALAELLKGYVVAVEEAGGNADDVNALWERVHQDVINDPNAREVKGLNYRGAGRKRKYTEEQEEQAIELIAEGRSLGEVSRITGIPKSTVFDLKNDRS